MLVAASCGNSSLLRPWTSITCHLYCPSVALRSLLCLSGVEAACPYGSLVACYAVIPTQVLYTHMPFSDGFRPWSQRVAGANSRYTTTFRESRLSRWLLVSHEVCGRVGKANWGCIARLKAVALRKSRMSMNISTKSVQHTCMHTYIHMVEAGKLERVHRSKLAPSHRFQL